jgi:DNA polymerase I-like protein with 3'-5' exonuclease and polymerase domains
MLLTRPAETERMSYNQFEISGYKYHMTDYAMQLPLFEEPAQYDAEALARCLRADEVAVDVETETRWPGYGPRLDYGLSYSADITIIALAWGEAGQNHTTVLTGPFDERVQDFLKTLFRRETPLVAHNAIFDIRQLSKLTDGQIPHAVWDTYVMARLLHPAVGASYNLIAVATALGIPIPEEQHDLKRQRGRLHTLPLALTLEYAQNDARLALQIYQRQREIPFSAELIDWECRAVREYCRMAARGIRLNIPFTEQRVEDLSRQRDELVRRLSEDGLTSPGSPKARARYLYEQKGIPLPPRDADSSYFTREGRRRLREHPESGIQWTDLSTRSDVIESYMEEDSPYRERLQDLAYYLETDWLLSTLNGLLEHAATDGRLHSLVTIATDTGRRASSYPHMQNWKMPAMAGVAIGDQGFTLVEIDYSNAENVMAAMISGDDHLSAACDADDFHSMMAVRYFGQAWTEADAARRKQLRGMSKKISYGTAYGMGAERLGISLEISTAEAQALMRAKDAAFPKMTRLRAVSKNQAERTGFLELWTGRRVAVPSAFVAWNYLCQGGVSEMLKRAVVLVSETFAERGWRSRVALDVHDALVLEVAHDEWDEALPLASRIMASIAPDDLVRRTAPPIHWRAAPNLIENCKKWGAQQWHPDE